MLEQFFGSLHFIEDLIWEFLGVPAIAFLGIYLSWKSGFVQIRKFPKVINNFYGMFCINGCDVKGVHPLKAFFASVGGCVGIGNIVSVCTAVKIGGPGALFWLWVTAILGVMLKYAEVYLGVRYRVQNAEGGYDGGPMYYLQRAFQPKWIASLSALLLCIYGVEIWQFSVIVHSMTGNFGISPYPVIGFLLLIVLFAGSGGVQRVGAISSAIIPFFLILYAGMACWVMWQYIDVFPEVMKMVLTSAFTGHAAVGGFVGTTLMITISQGVRRGCYTGDFGVGYASVIHSETCIDNPERQASLVFVGIILDTFIVCTASILLILMTGLWDQSIPVERLVQEALGLHFPYMNYFMPLFLFLLGYSTINAFFVVGLKCAQFVFPRLGKPFFYLYAVVAFILFSLIDAAEAMTIMTISGGLLLLINCWGIFRLRDEISYQID